MVKVGVISLGCDKNRVDTENMLAYLKDEGFVFTGDPADAEIIIVNTCAFIESAKREAIDTIIEMSGYKKGNCRCLVVTGCLPQRYMEELKEELQEADILLGTGSYRELPQILKEYKGNRTSLANDKDKRDFTSKRVLTTPYHYAYLKIAEGCDNHCTYCAIPSIRGKFTSREMDEIVQEAKELINDYGVKELNIVAQDITRYGIDIYGEYKLMELLSKLSETDVRWIRLLYCYPELVTPELIRYISQNPKIVKYIDIPMQHASSTVLKRMNRRVDADALKRLVNTIREIDPSIAIRTTFIVGFPGESEEEYRELYDFVKQSKFDRCGFFAYSLEEGTPAARMKGQIDEETKVRRVEELYALQHEIMMQKSEAMVGKVYEVIYDDIDYDNECFVGRTASDAPEIDRTVYFTSDTPLDIGEIYNVKITSYDDIDLIGVKI